MKKIIGFVLMTLIASQVFSMLTINGHAQATSSTTDQNDDLYYYLDGSAASTLGIIDITYSEVSQVNSTHIRLLTRTEQPIPLTNQWQSYYWILDTGVSTSGWGSVGGNLLDSNDLNVAYFVTVSWSADGSLYIRYSIFWDGTGTPVTIEDARYNPEKYFDGNKVFITLPLSAIGSPSSIRMVAGSSDGIGGSSGRHDKAPNTGHVTLIFPDPTPFWMQWWSWTIIGLGTIAVVFGSTTLYYVKKSSANKKTNVAQNKMPTKTYKLCSSCGASLPTDAKFCGKCGASLE